MSGASAPIRVLTGDDRTTEIATHLYLGIATEHGWISPRTHFRAHVPHLRPHCRHAFSAAQLSREIFDSFSLGRIRITDGLVNLPLGAKEVPAVALVIALRIGM